MPYFMVAILAGDTEVWTGQIQAGNRTHAKAKGLQEYRRSDKYLRTLSDPAGLLVVVKPTSTKSPTKRANSHTLSAFKVSIGSGDDVRWTATVDAKDRREARRKAVELHRNGDGQSRGSEEPSRERLKVTIEPASDSGH
jgi:hypothetical protein